MIFDKTLRRKVMRSLCGGDKIEEIAKENNLSPDDVRAIIKYCKIGQRNKNKKRHKRYTF